MLRTLVVLLLAALTLPSTPAGSCAELVGFVTAEGDQLSLDGKPFRFVSFNIPNLQLIEDNFAPDAETAWDWPNEYELNDALASVRQLGGTVVRTYALSVRREGSDMGDHVYVRGPGDFNEEAFQTLDLALEAAHRHGVRLIIPLVDNWQWQGGIAEYAAFRGKPAEAFWTDEQLIADFERTIEHVLRRVNTRTGIAYRDDPAILGWETGNELDAPPEWTARIARYIKSVDPNHLVIDGYALHGVREESLADPNIDMVTTHHYPNVGRGDYVVPIRAAREKCRGRKPYFVGEFGFIPPDEIEDVYDEVIRNGSSGALLWSLRFHNRRGGFYWHSEPAGGGTYKAYHWPGFKNGAEYGEREALDVTRRKAYEIRGEALPPRAAPDAPELLPIDDPGVISWRGSVGAWSYTVERAPSRKGPWSAIARDVDDAAVQYRPLFCDPTAVPGEVYFYRVTAHAAGGVSPPSNVVGPVLTKHRTFVDEGHDLSRVLKTIGGVEAVSGEDRGRGEDVGRLRLSRDSAVVYRTDEPIISFDGLFFVPRKDDQEPAALIEVLASADGGEFIPLADNSMLIGDAQGESDYGYLPRLSLAAAELPPGAKYLKFVARGEVELSHVTIRSAPNGQRLKATAATP